MEFIKGKYRIVTGITNEYKINPQNPKYFAKFVNDNIMTLGTTEDEAIERLKKFMKNISPKINYTRLCPTKFSTHLYQ